MLVGICCLGIVLIPHSMLKLLGSTWGSGICSFPSLTCHIGLIPTLYPHHDHLVTFTTLSSSCFSITPHVCVRAWGNIPKINDFICTRYPWFGGKHHTKEVENSLDISFVFIDVKLKNNLFPKTTFKYFFSSTLFSQLFVSI